MALDLCTLAAPDGIDFCRRAWWRAAFAKVAFWINGIGSH